ncbi:DUF433 domain-containing protein [Actibacterium sp. 188UL27-1]|uniref:DUF433 domain-containing protein n=1 Tax=Actibacterium sp. 188UL27-1 TaxID=2786961 RepID=UPI001EF50B54|nr:DUF433 domain-containing protein [Actibacterium sp. 188UL27-1]
MLTQVSADLTIKEAAHLAGVAPRRIEKDCEEGIVPRRKTKLWMRKTVAAHVPMHAVAYARAMQSLDGIKMEKKSKRRVWKFLRSSKADKFGSLELSPGLTLHLEPLVTEVWDRTLSYLETRHEHLAVDPDILGGEPILKGTRITCQSVLGRIESGETLDDLVEDYSEISKEAFEAALVYAKAHPPRGRPSAGKPWRKAA